MSPEPQTDIAALIATLRQATGGHYVEWRLLNAAADALATLTATVARVTAERNEASSEALDTLGRLAWAEDYAKGHDAQVREARIDGFDNGYGRGYIDAIGTCPVERLESRRAAYLTSRQPQPPRA